MTEDQPPEEPNAEPARAAEPERSAEASPAAPRPVQSPGPPAWTYLLTPFAVLLGSSVIIFAILVTDDPPAPAAEPIAPALRALTTAIESLPIQAAPAQAEMAAPPSRPETLLDALATYAVSLDLDPENFGDCLLDPANLEAVSEQAQRGRDLSVNGTPTFFVNNKIIRGAQPASIFAEVIEAELAGSPTTVDEYSSAVRQLASQDSPTFVIGSERPDISGGHIEGDPDAPVVIVEFSDFACPFCQRWYQGTLPGIREQLGDRVALVFLHYPIPQLHPNAPAAHLAAECAGAEGKFWEMHDLLFDRLAEWSHLPNPS